MFLRRLLGSALEVLDGAYATMSVEEKVIQSLTVDLNKLWFFMYQLSSKAISDVNEDGTHCISFVL